ncbi:MAG TPA: PP2C family protein-serine/threonine phosphatase [Leptospiraceae bacterium]|nr:PP2C family protein-serine/threonine phosphatase [Leptospiraceae bacterium]HMW06566.1 PP2C family protein-serine/threonine phosphatase [Leptospiraceae bacterium]HMX32134.1 PP2C family protein-serine/threonine phosphatase [Leptospiraceae bacterium]HMY31243.1 PP2C family protein-serine/threonine phosphatase [Leptospiraceae bacterium]HMZ63270.1 PP2C family protein-serine/threonine phosphatase [Leptospiraceae bacterium]
MIKNLISIYKTIYVNVPFRYRREFADKLRMDNLSRFNLVSFFILLLSPFMVWTHIEIVSHNYCNLYLYYCEVLFGAHYLGVFFALVYLIFYRFLNPAKWNKVLLEGFILISIFSFLGLFALSSLASQRLTGNISFFTTGAVFIAALFVTFKRYATLVYFSILFLFILGLYNFQTNPDLFFSNAIHSVVSIFFAYSLNLIFFHYKLDDFLKSKTIDQKTKEINDTLDDLKRDISVAKKIQTSLMKKNFAHIKNLNFSVNYIPLDEVGGDIYDISELSHKCIRIFLADATGHGVQAALITMAIKGEYESFKHTTHSPKKLLKNLNNDFVQKFGAIHSFFSCIVVDIYPEKNKIIYASAGHPDQVIQRKDWSLEIISRTGKIMGIMKDAEFEEKEIRFESGDKLLLFTDGLFEEFNSEKEEFGEKQILSSIKEYSDKDLKELFEEIMKNLNEFLENSSRQDDITFIGVEYDRKE